MSSSGPATALPTRLIPTAGKLDQMPRFVARIGAGARSAQTQSPKGARAASLGSGRRRACGPERGAEPRTGVSQTARGKKRRRQQRHGPPTNPAVAEPAAQSEAKPSTGASGLKRP